MINDSQLRWFDLEPIDAWFFRDSRPSNRGEDQSDLKSLFPPHPVTVAGALRAALASKQGWNGQNSWPDNLKPVLGDGGNLGKLSFMGPFLRKGEELIFPMPQHVMGYMKDTGQDIIFEPCDLLQPGKESVTTDAGLIRLPEVHYNDGKKGFKPPSAPENFFVSATGMNQILEGELPSAKCCIHARSIYYHEPRVGIQRDPDTGTTGEKALYSPQYIRLQRDVSMAVGISGLPEDWSLPSIFPFGGESRLAGCTQLETGPELPQQPLRNGKAIVLLLTPAHFSEDCWCGACPGDSAANLNNTLSGSVVTAAIDRPIRIGGWDSIKKQPLPTAPYVPAGSVWWLENALCSNGGNTLQLGARTAYGFGTALSGIWKNKFSKGGTRS